MSALDKEFEDVLLALSKHCEDDTSKLTDLFFGFLYRKTDFFSHQPIEAARNEVNQSIHRMFGQFEELMAQKHKERKEREEIERHNEAIRKRQIELEKAKEAELVRPKACEDVVMKTVGEYEMEKPKEKPREIEKPDEKENMDRPETSQRKEREETPEEKQKRQIEEAAERKRLMPNSGNGCDLPTYSWTQTLEQVEIRVPLRIGVTLKSRDVVIEMGKTHLKVGARGRDPVIDGDLFGEVVINEDATWLLEDKSVVNIVLPKKKKTQYWSKLVTTDPEVSTKKMVSDPLNFTDLEDDHKSVVEKMMYDARAKDMGLPTSDEKKKLDMIKKIKKINPDFNIDPSQIRLPGEQNSFSF